MNGSSINVDMATKWLNFWVNANGHQWRAEVTGSITFDDGTPVVITGRLITNPGFSSITKTQTGPTDGRIFKVKGQSNGNYAEGKYTLPENVAIEWEEENSEE